MQIKFEAKVWKTPYTNMDEITRCEVPPFITASDMSSFDYTLIGTAEVTANLFSQDKIVQSEIDSLNSQLQVERAESQRRQNAILDKISKLQAIEFTPA